MSAIIPKVMAKASSYGDLSQRAEPQEDACWEHERARCPKCVNDSEWFALLTLATALENSARLARSIELNNEDDRKAIASWIRYCDIRVNNLRGQLQAIADQEARDIHDAGKPFRHWQGGQP